MIVYRVCRAVHSKLDGEGARLFGGRWNSPGVAMIYTAEHPALAILEALVHFDLTIELIRDDYVVLPIALPEGSSKSGLEDVESDMSAFGDKWIASGASLALRVPSVVAPLSANVLLNPSHPRMTEVRAEPPLPWAPDQGCSAFASTDAPLRFEPFSLMCAPHTRHPSEQAGRRARPRSETP